MKNLKEENVDNDELMNIVNEIKKLFKEDRYNNDSIEELKNVYPVENEKLEEALLDYMGEIDPKSLKTDFLWNKWMCLIEKLAYPYEYFKRFKDYQKPVDNLTNENFFSKLKK